MNSTILLSVVLTLALVAMFALGLYWLNTKNRPQPLPPSPATAAASPAAHAAHATSSSFTPVDANEWEANAHWHEHDAHGNFIRHEELHQTSTACSGSISQTIDDARRELHEAFANEARDTATAFHPDVRADAAASTSSGSNPHCPQCRSSRIDTLNRARKAGSTIGSVAGATSGMAMALSGAEAGAVVGSFAGPIGTVLGGLAGAVIAGLVGSAAGCAAGSAVGAAIDDNVLDNHVCLSCGHAFSKAH